MVRAMDDANLEERIAEVEAIKRFGEEELGLLYGQAFTRVDIEPHRPGALYWLYASPKDKIAVPELRGWNKNRPYKFYTHKSSARRCQNALDAEGYDTFIYEATASSNINRPMTRSLLQAELHNRARTIFHEGFHITKEVRDLVDELEGGPRPWRIPYRLNEAIATVGGRMALQLYAKTSRQDLIEDAECGLEWWFKYAGFINRYHDHLTECYERGGDREEIFTRATGEAKILGFEFTPNNAFLFRAIDYTRDTPLVWEALQDLELCDYIADPSEIHAHLLEEIGEPFYG